MTTAMTATRCGQDGLSTICSHSL